MKEFELKEDHIKLLQRCYISWGRCEYGAPCINPKRPYGNSDVMRDIGEILGVKPLEWDCDGEERHTPENEKYFEKLHKELEDALQIVLRTKSFEPGIYQCSDYGGDWVRV